jgi:hypothetical protein
MILKTTCRGGLPCFVEMGYERADPNVGYFHGYWFVENIQIRPGEDADWIVPTEEDEKRFCQEAEERAQDDYADAEAQKNDYQYERWRDRRIEAEEQASEV